MAFMMDLSPPQWRESCVLFTEIVVVKFAFVMLLSCPPLHQVTQHLLPLRHESCKLALKGLRRAGAPALRDRLGGRIGEDILLAFL